MRWEPWRWGVQWLAIGSGLWSVKRIIEPDPLTAIVEVAEVLNINPSTIIHIWSKLESWKSLISGCLMKIIILKCCLLLFYVTTMNYFLIGLWCVTKSGFYMTTGDDQLSGCTEKLQILPKAKLAPKKHHGHCLVVCCCSDPLLLSESQWNHYRSMLSKSMKLTVNCRSCSQHWSTERVQFFSMTTPNYMLHNQRFKSWTNWAMKFGFIGPILLTSCQWTTITSSILTTFCRENASITTGGRKCFPRVCWILKHRFLSYRNKQIYFSLAKMCWL